MVIVFDGFFFGPPIVSEKLVCERPAVDELGYPIKGFLPRGEKSLFERVKLKGLERRCIVMTT